MKFNHEFHNEMDIWIDNIVHMVRYNSVVYYILPAVDIA